MPFLNNLLRAETWSIAADFNHIAHPLSLTEAQIQHKDPDLADRIGGSILFALSMLFVVPACLYLFWASRKVEQIDNQTPESAEGRTHQAAQGSQAFNSCPVTNKEATDKRATEGSGAPQLKEVFVSKTKETEDKKKGLSTPSTPLTSSTPSGRTDAQITEAPQSLFPSPVLSLLPSQSISPAPSPSTEKKAIFGFNIPEVTKKSLDWLFGNDKIVDRAPFYSLVKGDENYFKPESFEFPVMKGVAKSSGKPGSGGPGLLPFIVLKVVPVDIEAYFERHEKRRCQNLARKVANFLRKTQTAKEIGLVLKKSLLEQIGGAIPAGTDPEAYFEMHKKDRYQKNAEKTAEILMKNGEEKSADRIYALLRDQELEAIKEMVLIEDPEAYFEEHRKESCLEDAQVIAETLNEMKPKKTEEELYLQIKEDAFERIKNGKLISIAKWRPQPEFKPQSDSSLSWFEHTGVWGGEEPGFFTFKTSDSWKPNSMLTYSDTGEVIKEAKECAAPFQKLIAEGSATDAHGVAWQMMDYEKVKELFEIK